MKNHGTVAVIGLPWWAKLIIARTSGHETFVPDTRHYHSCSCCDGIIYCKIQNCRNHSAVCAACGVVIPADATYENSNNKTQRKVPR
mgnify:CR=1 FL=1